GCSLFRRRSREVPATPWAVGARCAGSTAELAGRLPVTGYYCAPRRRKAPATSDIRACRQAQGVRRARFPYYVCAEGGGGGMVSANRTEMGLWEVFHIIPLGGVSVNLSANVSGNYLSAEPSGVVWANRRVASDWERFEMTLLEHASAGSVAPPS